MKLLVVAVLMLVASGCKSEPVEPYRHPPVVVMSPFQLSGALVVGARSDWAVHRRGRVRYGDPVPVRVSEYCLKGTTRRDNYVRDGIVAADPRFFPLAQYIELYVGKELRGRFLVDDTGPRIRGERIDVWTADCPHAERFGIQRGTAVLVRKQSNAIQLAGRVR